jgi:hypothetical protein
MPWHACDQPSGLERNFNKTKLAAFSVFRHALLYCWRLKSIVRLAEIESYVGV